MLSGCSGVGIWMLLCGGKGPDEGIVILLGRNMKTFLPALRGLSLESSEGESS